jgi:hypothetical protein
MQFQPPLVHAAKSAAGVTSSQPTGLLNQLLGLAPLVELQLAGILQPADDVDDLLLLLFDDR